MGTIKRTFCLLLIVFLVTIAYPMAAFAENEEDIQTTDTPLDNNILISSITVVSNNGVSSLTVGETLSMQITIEPEDASDQTVIWSSSDETVAVVDSAGMITALSVGTVTINATAMDGSDVSGEFSISIIDTLPDIRTSAASEEQLRTLLAEGGEIDVPDDINLTSDIIIPEGTSLQLNGRLSIPESITLINNGTLCIGDGIDVYGTLDNRASGVIDISASATGDNGFTVFAPESLPAGRLLNAGIINLYGSLVIESGADFSGEQLPINLYKDGQINGTDNFTLVSDDTTSTDTVVEPTGEIFYSEYIKSVDESSVIELNGDIVIDQTLTISSDKIMRVVGGTVKVAAGITLANDSMLEISGGELVIEADAALINNGFILVQNSGVTHFIRK